MSDIEELEDEGGLLEEEMDEEDLENEAELLEREEEEAGIEGEEEEEEEAEEEVEPNPLNQDHMYGGNLYMLEYIGTGMSCAYVRLDVNKRELTDIDLLEKYIHLRYIDISENFIKSLIPLCTITQLCSLTASKNRLQYVQLDELPYLQNLDLSHNKITSTEGMTHPLLEDLNLNDNRISRISFRDVERLQCLRILDLRGNRISSMDAEFPPNLEELYLPSNVIERIERVGYLPKLKKLHLRDNQIESLDGLVQEQLPVISYLNLRGNNLCEAKDLKKIRGIVTITEIMVEGNPFTDSETYREEVVAALGCRRSLKRIDKDEMDDEELTLGMDKMEEMDKQEENTGDEVPDDMKIREEKSTESELKFTMSGDIK